MYYSQSMSLVFHPKVLDLLSRFKKTGNKNLLKSVLALLIDNTKHLDISHLRHVVFSYSKPEDGEQGEVQNLEKLVQQEFVKKKVGGVFVCFARRLKRNKYFDIITENRKNEPSIFGNKSSENFIDAIATKKDKDSPTQEPGSADSSGIVPQGMLKANGGMANDNAAASDSPIDFTDGQPPVNEGDVGRCGLSSGVADLVFDEALAFRSVPDMQSASKRSMLGRKLKSRTPQSNTLNFFSTKATAAEQIKKFAPLNPKNAVFVYDRNNIVLDTQRKRDDLVNPVKLQFIKHFDQIRPPIYQKRGPTKRAVFSYMKIPGMLTYDHDSSEDWEVPEESTETPEECSEDTNTELDAQSEEEWIEKDSEDAETTRYSKKPNLLFECNVHVETFFEKSKFLHANLVFSENFSEELQGELEKYQAEFQGGFEELVSLFSALYNVSQSVVREKLAKIVRQERQFGEK